MQNKTIIFLADGMADEPLKCLNNKTPLKYAKTPAMDSIAVSGNSGTLLTLPEGFPASSEVANMSILGCDLEREYCGRGPLEALGRGLDISEIDHIFRLNLTTQQNRVMTDFSGGHIDQNTAEILISKLNDEFATEHIRFHSGVSYRNLLILSGQQYSHRLTTDKPDDIQGKSIDQYLPSADEPAAKKTIDFILDLIERSPAVLNSCNASANSVWVWGGGSLAPFKQFRDKYNINGAVISGVDVIRGIGRGLGMDVIEIPSSKHYTKPDYATKTEAALEALPKYEFIYIHEDAPDEASHKHDLDYKIKAIEDFDQKVVAPVLKQMPAKTNVVILPDHPTPVSVGTHTRTAVPISAKILGLRPDGVMTFDEDSCKNGSLGVMHNDQLMKLVTR